MLVHQVQDVGHAEEYKPTSRHLDHADVKIRIHQHSPVNHTLTQRVSGLLTHQTSLRRLESICDSSPDVSSDVNEQHLGYCQRGGNTQQLGEGGHDLWYLRAQRVHDRLLQILRAQPALAHCFHHRGELVVQQNNVSGLLGDLSSTDAHCHTNFRCLQGRSIVDTISGHGNHRSSDLLVGADDDSLVHRGDTSENTSVLHSLPPELHLLLI
mmetsp:Transcript_50842/g.115528  ORF Transcript_50842/g.115528 Transcript_50842/m.115528 type:complete len:211 (-) Transcript_50842:2478-3110(-)